MSSISTVPPTLTNMSNSVIDNLATLPQYSPSLPAPSYNPEPNPDEQRLQHTPSTTRPIPTGIYTKKSENIVVVLEHQENDAMLPTYGLRGHLSGKILLQDTDSISEITLTMEGILNSMKAGSSSKSVKLISSSHKLWTIEAQVNNPCPSRLSFSFLLPPTYNSNGEAVPLPPSYHVAFPGIASLYVICQYNITVAVRKSQRFSLGTRAKIDHIAIPFIYYPRMRSRFPIIRADRFFSSIKTEPEEWYQSSSVMRLPSSQMDPVHSHIFLPAGRTFAISETLPFHVQLTGPKSSLQFLMRPSENDVNLPTSAVPTPVRMVLLRQVCVEIEGLRTVREIIIGELDLSSIPIINSADTSRPESQEGYLDWDGELRCKEDVTVCGFTAENVTVKDFVVLLLSPPSTSKTLMSGFRHAVAIKLVTDAYAEIAEPEL